MLGKLARWLRIIGYDTLYDSSISDDEIISRSIKEDRIILTRDTLLVKRRGVSRYLFIESDHIKEQFRQVVDAYGLSIDYLFNRCLHCNTSIKPVDKEKVKKQVPPYVFKTQSWFARCPSCGKIYWQGTHADQVRKFLQNV
jgi:uncharacterized protein with PIN domain